MPLHRRTLLKLGLVAPAAYSAGAAASGNQGYPDRSVRVIVPFAAGGPTDTTARIVAQGLSERLGQPFYVENLPGAGGNTGTAQAARAAPDGHTLLMVSTGFVINPSLYAKVPYDPLKDFAPITIACSTRNVLVINPELPAKTAHELVELIKASPTKYSYAQPGFGSTGHLVAEMFRLQFGLDVVMVPFAGAAPALTSTIAGHTGMAWVALPSALPYVRGGKLRMLTLSGDTRSALVPQVPTFKEIGLDVPPNDVLTALLAPAETPEPIVRRLYEEVARYVAQPDIRQKLLDLGFEPVANRPEDYATRIDTDVKRWAKALQHAHIPQIQ